MSNAFRWPDLVMPWLYYAGVIHRLLLEYFNDKTALLGGYFYLLVRCLP